MTKMREDEKETKRRKATIWIASCVKQANYIKRADTDYIDFTTKIDAERLKFKKFLTAVALANKLRFERFMHTQLQEFSFLSFVLKAASAFEVSFSCIE